MNRQGILDTLSNNKKNLAELFGVKSLALFGSFSRNENRESSDIDLLVEFHTPPGLFDFFRLQHHLENLLGGVKVDLLMPPAIKPAIQEHVLNEAVYIA